METSPIPTNRRSSSAQHARRVAQVNRLALLETFEGEGAHIIRRLTRRDQAGHPLTDYGRKLEAVPAKTSRAVQTIVRGEAAQDRVRVRRIVVDTGPSTARHRACQRRQVDAAPGAEVGNL